MREPADREFFGPYRLVRRLAPSASAERWMALHVRSQTSHIVHRFFTCRDRAERRRFLDAFESMAQLHHPHLLRIEQFSFGSAGRPWGVTPYPGNQDGLVTLAQLAELKGGRLGEFESQRAIEQILGAAAFAHKRGIIHGVLTADEILVDRHGALLVEHYGLSRLIEPSPTPADEAIFDEVRSIAALGYTLMTGLTPNTALIAPSRVNRRIDRLWDSWFARALDAGADFDSAQTALDALQGRAPEPDQPGPVKVVLRKLRKPAEPV